MYGALDPGLSPRQDSGFRVYPNPKIVQNNGPKPLTIAIKAIILHTFGVQVGVQGEGFKV